jgi:DnaK suppressor protein
MKRTEGRQQMARKDALLRLHERLVAKRDALRKKLAEDLSLAPVSTTGDEADAANDGAQNELNSQLAALESRELIQVDRAIDLIRQGRYGVCEICEEQIPIERLKALPFTPVCVNCQRVQERMSHKAGDDDADWESAFELEGRLRDRELTLGDIDIAD